MKNYKIIFTVFLVLYFVLPVLLAEAQTEIVTTSSLSLDPNITELNQETIVKMQVNPPGIYNGLTLKITTPEEYMITLGPFTSNINGTQNTIYIPQEPGTYILQLIYPGDAGNSSTTYLASTSQEFFLTVNPTQNPLNETSGTWTQKTALPLRSWGIIALNNKIYAIAGSGDYGNVTYSNNAVFEFDPDLNNWNIKNIMPITRYSFSLAAYQNRIYVIGEPDGLNQVYDPITDTWENRTSMPTPRTQLEANVVEGKIYLIAGRTGGASSTVALNEVYDPETDTWTTKEPIPFPVVQYASAVVDKKIYIIGGQDEYESPLNLEVTQIYDTISDSWTFGAPLPKVVWQADAGATTGNYAPKRIYVIGGLPQRELIAVNWTQIYNPETNTWTNGEPIPTARFQLDVVVLNDILYVMRGSPFFNLNGIYSYENEQYTPANYIPEFSSMIIFPILILSFFLFGTLFALLIKKNPFHN